MFPTNPESIFILWNKLVKSPTREASQNACRSRETELLTQMLTPSQYAGTSRSCHPTASRIVPTPFFGGATRLFQPSSPRPERRLHPRTDSPANYADQLSHFLGRPALLDHLSDLIIFEHAMHFESLIGSPFDLTPESIGCLGSWGGPSTNRKTTEFAAARPTL